MQMSGGPGGHDRLRNLSSNWLGAITEACVAGRLVAGCGAAAAGSLPARPPLMPACHILRRRLFGQRRVALDALQDQQVAWDPACPGGQLAVACATQCR